jgi:hypothetical protein
MGGPLLEKTLYGEGVPKVIGGKSVEHKLRIENSGPEEVMRVTLAGLFGKAILLVRV